MDSDVVNHSELYYQVFGVFIDKYSLKKHTDIVRKVPT